MEIREAQLADLDALIELSRDTFEETFGYLYPLADLQKFLATAYTQESYTEQIQGADSNIWVLVDGEKLCGYVTAGNCILPHPEVRAEDGEIKRIYLRATYQKGGWGTRLFETALDWLISRGKSTIWLGVWSNNYGAQKLYRRHGFTHAGEYHFVVGENRDRAFIYRKIVTEEEKSHRAAERGAES